MAEEKVKPTGIRFPADLKREAKIQAITIDRSLNWYTVQAVREKLERDQKRAEQ